MRPSQITEFAVTLVREAGQFIRSIERPRHTESKSSPADLRTSTDIAVEKFLAERIRGSYPDHQIVGEEGTFNSPTVVELDQPVWFVDPVDGTTNYFRDLPLFGCNIAFWSGGEILTGAILDAAQDIVYWAEAGKGSWANSRRLAVSEVQHLAHGVLATGFPYDGAGNPDNNLAEFGALMPRTRAVRRIGCAGLDLAWVASGRFDGYWEKNNGPWDWAAGALLVKEAGGEVTTYDGRPWTPLEETILATNGRLHEVLLGAIAGARLAAGLPRVPGTTSI